LIERSRWAAYLGDTSFQMESSSSDKDSVVEIFKVVEYPAVCERLLALGVRMLLIAPLIDFLVGC
jgi:hypothetical protein